MGPEPDLVVLVATALVGGLTAGRAAGRAGVASRSPSAPLEERTLTVALSAMRSDPTAGPACSWQALSSRWCPASASARRRRNRSSAA